MYVQKPGYVVADPVNGNYESVPIWVSSLNEMNFQVQWTGLTTGTLQVVGSNMDLPADGPVSYVSPIPRPAGYVPPTPVSVPQYPPPLTPFVVGTPFTVAAVGSTDFDVVTAAGWVWIRYTGAGVGSISIAFSGKAYS